MAQQQNHISFHPEKNLFCVSRCWGFLARTVRWCEVNAMCSIYQGLRQNVEASQRENSLEEMQISFVALYDLMLDFRMHLLVHIVSSSTYCLLIYIVSHHLHIVSLSTYCLSIYILSHHLYIFWSYIYWISGAKWCPQKYIHIGPHMYRLTRVNDLFCFCKYILLQSS